MKFQLADIELHIADPILEKAELLIEAQAIRQFQEIERNLWVALIEDQETFEVEVQISPSKVKAYTCDCAVIKQSGICQHVAAILILLRKRINARREKAQQRKEQTTKKTKVPNRITTTTILDLVKPNELKAFVKKYASQDRTFTLMLKAQFAHIVPGHEEKEHISKVLQNTIKSVIRPGKRINNSGVKLIQKVTNTILTQSEEALYKKHYADVFDSISAIILQLAPLMNSANEDDSFSKLINRSYQLLNKLYKSKIAPQLDQEIWEFVSNECKRAAYYLNQNWTAPLSLILLMANAKNRQDKLATILENLEAERYVVQDADIRSALLNTRLSLLNRQDNQAAMEFFLKYNMNDKEILLKALQLSADKEDWPQVKQLATYGLEQQILDEEVHLVNEYFLKAAVEKKEKRNIIKYATLCFHTTYDFKHLELIKSVSGKKWKSFRDNLLKEMMDKPYGIENRNAIAKIFADEKLDHELFDFIVHSKSLDLLKVYDKRLRLSFGEKLPTVYKSLIFNYLNNYIGRPAANKIRQSIEHLLAQDQNKLAKSLLQEIRKEYSDRNALMEELGRF